MRVHLALLSVQLLFGLWPVAGSYVLERMSPSALIGFRLMAGAPLLVLVAGLPWRPLPSRRELVHLAVLAALGISINQLLFAEGLSRAGPINASLSILLVPAISLVIASVLGQERPTKSRLAGVALALAGAAILLRVERFDLGDRAIVGNLMLCTNATVYAAFLVLARPVIAKLGSLRSMGFIFAFGALEAAPLTLPAMIDVPWLGLSAPMWGALAFILVGATLATYLLNAYALARVESSVVAVYVYLQPVIASLASWWLLGLVPEARTLAAGGVIVLGVALATQAYRVLTPRVAEA